jgi:[acyl-carrier-protein] S-malonyltransferase
VVANVTAEPYGDVGEIRGNLVKQITATVRWRESIQWLAGHGVTRFVELGAGKVLTGLVKRIVPEAEATSAGTPDEMRALAESLA